MLTGSEKIKRNSAEREESRRFICAISGCSRYGIETVDVREEPAVVTIDLKRPRSADRIGERNAWTARFDRRYRPHRSDGVCTGLSQCRVISSSSTHKVIDAPAIS